MVASTPRGVTAPAAPGTVAVVGAGAFGRFCVEAYRQSPDIQVVSVTDPRFAGNTVDGNPSLRIEADWRTAIARPDVEVVHVVTPPHIRSEIVRGAMEAGKSVLCEKPLALTLDEADQMIRTADAAKVALGVDYVMRFQPAYRFLHDLAMSGIAGAARSLSFQNFAQDVPAGHWFWDRTQSGGILVEHGVHFFDCYGRVAGRPVTCVASEPRDRAIDVTLWYEGMSGDGPRTATSAQGDSSVVARYYHEFAFPQAVEYASGVVMFERGHISIEGWIPTRLSGVVMANPQEVTAVAAPSDVNLSVMACDEGCTFEACFPDREASYASAVVAAMRDVLLKHRDREHRMTVTAGEARQSLAVALGAQESAISGAPVEFGGIQVVG
jgi:predicted dehydrogenase